MQASCQTSIQRGKRSRWLFGRRLCSPWRLSRPLLKDVAGRLAKVENGTACLEVCQGSARASTTTTVFISLREPRRRFTFGRRSSCSCSATAPLSYGAIYRLQRLEATSTSDARQTPVLPSRNPSPGQKLATPRNRRPTLRPFLLLER